MIDLHTHTVFSDGELIPAELIQRYTVKGCRYLAITDHVDLSMIDQVIPRMVQMAAEYSKQYGICVFPGCELTHIPPATYGDMVKRARQLGAKIVVAHGETVVEPVAAGTNRAAIEAGVDILAHPGLITDDEVKLAREKGVFLEITRRGGHSLTNGHVCALAKKHGAPVIFSTDSHSPDNLATKEIADTVLRGAGYSVADLPAIWKAAEALCKRKAGV